MGCKQSKDRDSHCSLSETCPTEVLEDPDDCGQHRKGTMAQWRCMVHSERRRRMELRGADGDDDDEPPVPEISAEELARPRTATWIALRGSVYD